jgi:hypothetical protein
MVIIGGIIIAIDAFCCTYKGDIRQAVMEFEWVRGSRGRQILKIVGKR